MIKDNNEITVSVLMSENELIDALFKSGYEKVEDFTIEDTYFLPINCDKERKTLEILNDCILLRDFGDRIKLTRKYKEYDTDENITFQKSTDLAIRSREDGTAFLNAIGYEAVMTVKDDATVMGKDGLEFVIERVNGGRYLMIEIEENERYQTVDSLIKKLDETGIIYDRGSYFVKKAELVYNEKYGKR